MSAVAVKLDENLSQAHVDIVRQAGYEADRVTDQGLAGADDAAVWQHVIASDRFFITLDLDFADVRSFLPGTHPGLLLLRPRNKSQAAVSEILERVLRDHPRASLRSCFVVADLRQTRIRRPASAGAEGESAD